MEESPTAFVATHGTRQRHQGLKRGNISKTDDLAEVITSPANYAQLELGFKLYPKQRQFLELFGKAVEAWLKTQLPQQISFASANSGGKTVICELAAILWLLNIFPEGRINCTSGSFRQLKDQLRPALARMQAKYPQWKWTDEKIVTDKGGFLRLYSCAKEGRAEGDHSDGLQRPLVVFVDEAKSVPPWLKRVIEGRVRPAVVVLLSSHGFADGEWFHASQTTNAAKYTIIQQTAYECPHIALAEIKKVIDDWKGFPAYADSVLGLGFIPLIEDAVINAMALSQLYTAIADDEVKADEDNCEVHGFCDFAWLTGGDENVLALRHGNVVTLEDHFHADNLHKICDQFIASFKRLQLKAHQLSGDEGGGGKLIMDELDQRGWRLHRINNGATPKDAEHYASVAAEFWYEGSKWITDKTILLPDDLVLKQQLMNRKRKPGPKGKLAIESKEEMKERNVGSPDRAEAVLGCMMPVGGYGASQPLSPKNVFVPKASPVNPHLTFGV